jgi:Fe-S-cluster containining protein
MKNKTWHCAKCGKCCKFIVIPVKRELDLETEMYLMAHGIAHDGKKIIVPAVCKYLKKGDLRGDLGTGEYYCSIHNNKFANCRLGGEKECREAQKAWKLLEEMEND